MTYELGLILACPLCGHEWAPEQENTAVDVPEGDARITDAFGTPLSDGDSVTVLKTLKVKGSTTPVKVGTKVRGIRLVDGVGDHDIECRIEGIGVMQLKSSLVKKA